MWGNAFLYNPKGSDLYVMTAKVSQAFEEQFRELEGIAGQDGNNKPNKNIDELQKRVEELTKEIKVLHQKGSKPPSFKSGGRNQNMDKPMTL